jgi:hypothetical protein
LFGDTGWQSIILIISSVALALGSTLLWSLSWHWVLRLAGVLALSFAIVLIFLLAWVAGEIRYYDVVLSIFTPYYLIQGIMISAWLGLGALLPASKPNPAEDGPPPSQ